MKQKNHKKSNLNKDFQGQREDEKVILILQKYWFILFWPFIKGILFIGLALILPSIGGIGFYIFNSSVISFVYIVWLIFWASYLAYEYLNWYRDKFIITDHRVINIDQKSLFKRRVSELELDKIQDVSHEITGMFATALNFGSVIIQSAGSDNMVIEDIAKPTQLQDIIVRLAKEANANLPVTVDELVDFIKEHRV